jgi:peptidoglycan-N-acetylglucosamine deacetylase
VCAEAQGGWVGQATRQHPQTAAAAAVSTRSGLMRGTLSDGRPTRETRVSHVGPEGADWPCLNRSGPGQGLPGTRGAPSVGDDNITPALAGSRYPLSVRIGPSWYVTLAAALVLSACSGIPAALSTSTSPPAPTSTGTPSALAQPTATTSTPSPTTSCPSPAAGFVTSAPGTGKTVALTFDDGPGPDDAALLQILVAHHVPATFFLTGVHSAAQPAQVRALAQAGELVADHSYDHRYPREVSGGWTVPYLLDQITRTNAVLTDQTKAPVCFFRPPGGFQDSVLKAASAAGMSAVLWSVDSSDWKQPDHVTAAATQAIVAAATTVGTQTHPVVLLHSGKASHEPSSVVSPFRGNTLAALPQIIDWYATNGYRFVDLTGRSTGA